MARCPYSFIKKIIAGEAAEVAQANLVDECRALEDDFAFIAESNIGGEFMAADRIERIKEISKHHWYRTLDDQLGLSTEEMLQKAYTESKSRIKIFAVPHKERQLDYQHSTKASETTASDESHK